MSSNPRATIRLVDIKGFSKTELIPLKVYERGDDFFAFCPPVWTIAIPPPLVIKNYNRELESETIRQIEFLKTEEKDHEGNVVYRQIR